MSVSDKDIIEACMPILQSVRTHNSGERCFLTAYQIWILLAGQSGPICERLRQCYGDAVGEGGGAHVGPAQRIGQALGRSEDIETRYLNTRKILFQLQEQIPFRASGRHCGLFRLRRDDNARI